MYADLQRELDTFERLGCLLDIVHSRQLKTFAEAALDGYSQAVYLDRVSRK